MKQVNKELKKLYLYSCIFNKNININNKKIKMNIGKSSIISIIFFYIYKTLQNLKSFGINSGDVVLKSTISTVAIVGTAAIISTATSQKKIETKINNTKKVNVKILKEKIVKKKIIKYNYIYLLSGEKIKAIITEKKNSKIKYINANTGKLCYIKENQIFLIK